MRTDSLLATLVAGVAFSATPVSSNLPQFNRAVLLETASDTSANASIGDLNGDGNLDILLVKGRHWPGTSRVLFGDGRGRFLAAHDLAAVKYRSYSGRLVDIDGDGDLDVVLSNDAPDPKVVFLNDGTGTFGLGSTFGRAEWGTRNATVADLNGDRRLDVIVANRGDSAFQYTCLNNGSGRFDADCVPFAHMSATTITAADFNHDGLVDLAVPHRDGGQSYVYLNGGNAAFPEATRVPFGPPDASIRMAETADLDGDGILDIMAIDERRGVAMYRGLANGTFASAVPIDNGKVTPYALSVGDLNRDGKIDIVVGNVEAPSTIFYNDGSGRRYTAVHFGDNRGTVYGFAIADLDRDGRLDIVVARSEAPNVAYVAASR